MITGTIIQRAGSWKMRAAAAAARTARMAEEMELAAIRRKHMIPVKLEQDVKSAEEHRDVARSELQRLVGLRLVHEDASRRAGKITKDLSALDRRIAQQRNILTAAEDRLATARNALDDHNAAIASAPAQEAVVEEPECAEEPALDVALTPRRGRPKKTVTP